MENIVAETTRKSWSVGVMAGQLQMLKGLQVLKDGRAEIL
jgi:hypothetical protein